MSSKFGGNFEGIWENPGENTTHWMTDLWGLLFLNHMKYTGNTIVCTDMNIAEGFRFSAAV